MGITVSKREWGPGSMKKRSTGISARKQGFRKKGGADPGAETGAKSSSLSQAWQLDLEKEEQEERSSYPPVFLINRKYTRVAITATPARTPITMPAIAPGARPGFDCVKSPIVERREKNEWKWHYFTVGSPGGQLSMCSSLYFLFLQGIHFLWKVAVRWLADFILRFFFSLTVFLGLWSDLPQFHPGLSVLRYFWRLWKCEKEWLLFFYNFPPFHVPAVAATSMYPSDFLWWRLKWWKAWGVHSEFTHLLCTEPILLTVRGKDMK